MRADRVAAHLSATRITGLGTEAEGQLAAHYRGWHQSLTARLRERFSGLESTELYVACTANAQSQLLAAPNATSTIVHDQHLGRTLNRLTGFVIHGWPTPRVHGWAFERIATAAFAQGDLDGAALALSLRAESIQRAEPPQIDSGRDFVRQLWVTIQEFFVLAHEIAHSALGPRAHAQLESHLREEITAAMRDRRQVRADHDEAIANQMAQDVTQAVRRHLDIRPPTLEELEQMRRAVVPEDDLDEEGWLAAHQYLYEEIACDLIATELTLEHFAEIDAEIDPSVALPAILMGLHHLTSLEYLTVMAEGRLEQSGGTLESTVVRKTVWRRMAIAMYGAATPQPLGQSFVDVTQDHAAKVGDQVLFIVPVLWRQAQKLLAERQSDPARASKPDRARMRDLIWSFAAPNTAPQGTVEKG